MLPHLPFLAEFSKAVSVLVVLLLLGLMIIYLSRVSIFPDLTPGSSSSVTWVHGVGVSQQPMLLRPNPFHLQLLEASLSAESHQPSSNDADTGESHLRLSVSSKVTCACLCLWGVDLRGLHALLAWPWAALRQALLSPGQQRTPGFSLLCEPLQHVDGSTILKFEVPVLLRGGTLLGTPPRHRCPMMVALFIPEEISDVDVLGSDTVVALVSVVHVRDPLVSMATGVLSQFLKQANGQVTLLQPLFVTGVPSSINEDTERHERPQDEINLCCVVCHVQPASLALLPCRHACLCPDCLPRLKDCPLCRTPIHSYFYVVHETSLNPVVSNDAVPITMQDTEYGRYPIARLRHLATTS